MRKGALLVVLQTNCRGDPSANLRLSQHELLSWSLDRHIGETLLQPSANVAIDVGDGVPIVGRLDRAQTVESLSRDQR
jgi:hypothetical protein